MLYNLGVAGAGGVIMGGFTYASLLKSTLTVYHNPLKTTTRIKPANVPKALKILFLVKCACDWKIHQRVWFTPANTRADLPGG